MIERNIKAEYLPKADADKTNRTTKGPIVLAIMGKPIYKLQVIYRINCKDCDRVYVGLKDKIFSRSDF